MKVFCCSVFLTLWVVTSPAAVTGQWDFENGDLSATVGSALQCRGTTASETQFGTTTSFGIADIKGEVAHVMRFPATSNSQGYEMPHGASPNGGGTKVNQYTVILDVLFPAASGGYRALWQTDTNNTSDADLFVNGANGIGITGIYQGDLSPDTWHRVVFTVDLVRRELGKYIDGTNVLSAPAGASPGTNLVQYLDATTGQVDQRWALDTAALLFADEDNETGAGFVNSIQFQDRVLWAEEIAALGGPSAAGIPSGAARGIAQWDFNGNLASSTGGTSLKAEAAAPATTAGVSFTNTTINGQTAQVATFTRGTFFRMGHGLPANGGGSTVNQYTLLMDVLFPSRPTGWAALLQTSPDNSNDGDWFINASGGLGISSVYGGSLANGTWNRLALVVDALSGTFTSYLNGTQVQQISAVSLDGRWSLATDALLFADEDQENAGGSVNSVQLRATAMNAADIAALGGPEATGIPLPQQPTGLQLLAPNGGEVFQAGTTQTVAWSVSNASGLAQIDLLVGEVVYRSLGQALMRQSNFSWVIDDRLGDTNTYRIRISSVDYPAMQDKSDAYFAVTGSGSPPNLLYGQPLQLNGDFESFLTNWQVIAGHPVALTSADGKGAPYSGSRFFYAGFNPGNDAIIRQEIDLVAAGFSTNELDAESAVDAEAWLRNAYSTGVFDDQVYYRVGFLDGGKRELGGVRSLIGGSSGWVRRPLWGTLPPGTRSLRLEVIGKHRRDADNDSMADQVIVRLQRAWPQVSPQITKLPMLQDVRTNAMTLFWETDGNLAAHRVEWGRTSVAENTCVQVETIEIDATHFVHRATLEGLSPETSYVYRVRSGATNSAIYAFRTAPRRETPFAAAWWGDSQVGPTVLQQLIPSMLAHGVDWMGEAGDLVSSGSSLSDWNNYWFKALEFKNIGQTKPALFAHGNHDGEHPYCYAYGALPGNESYYAFDYGNSRFIFLDSEASTDVSPEQYSWLTNELARSETQNAAFRVVCFHKLPYANLWNGGGYIGEYWVRTDWVPVFERYHVDVVVNGHAHNYNRGVTNGVTYVVSGGGGGALDTERVAHWPLFTVEYSRYHYCHMRVNGNVLAWNVYDTSDQLLDNFTLTSRVPQLALGRGEGAGQASLVLTGKPGENYILESSSGLDSWSTVSSNTVPLVGMPSVTIPVPVDSAQRFFRARASR